MKKKIAAVLITAALAFAGTKLIVHTSNGPVSYPLSTVDSLTFVEMGNNATGPSVFLDNFEINTLYSDHSIADSTYTNQSSLAYQYGGSNFSSDDIAMYGGGYWYGFTSDNGAKIKTWSADGTETIVVDSAEFANFNNEAMLPMFRNDSLIAALDCRSTSDNSYWAGIGLSIAGDGRNDTDIEGVTVKRLEGAEYSCWNLSSLESITLEGTLMGAVNLTFVGAASDDLHGYSTYELIKSSNKAEDISMTIPMEDFTPGYWQGAQWPDIMSLIHSLSFELNPSYTGYAELKLNSIILNFKDEDSKLEAFHFLK